MELKKNHNFSELGFIINRIRFLSPREAYPILISGTTLVDMRKSYETNYRVFDVPKVVYSSKEKLLKKIDSLFPLTPFILADNVGLDSKVVAQKLIEHGVNDFACLIGGMVGWMDDKLPVIKDPEFELRGPCSCQLRTRKKVKKKKSF